MAVRGVVSAARGTLPFPCWQGLQGDRNEERPRGGVLSASPAGQGVLGGHHGLGTGRGPWAVTYTVT